MNSIRIELPPNLASALKVLGVVADVDVSAWVTDAIRQKLSATKQLEYLESRGLRGNREAFQAALSKVPAIEPAEEDRW